MTVNSLQPFLKWAGGKRWFVQRHLKKIPCTYRRYIEPFLGSGALYFALCPRSALLSDINEELIDTYNCLKNDWKEVLAHLKHHQTMHSKDYYYKIRSTYFDCLPERAARFIYLNRTCWNGLYRVNLNGKFNVPIGTKQNVLMQTDNFELVHRVLQDAKVVCDDFEQVIEQAVEGDIVFADPPYTVKHNDNGFIKYNQKLFSWDDQVRLASCLARAKSRGAMVISTNANHLAIRKLYEPFFSISVESRHSVLASDPNRRRKCEELVIRG